MVPFLLFPFLLILLFDVECLLNVESLEVTLVMIIYHHLTYQEYCRSFVKAFYLFLA